MKIIILVLFITLSPLIFTGCSSSKSYSPKEYELNGAWELQNLHGKTADIASWPNGVPWMKLNVSVAKQNGSTGCNTMEGSFHATEELINFGNIISTRMFCEEVDETGFLDALQSSHYWTIENDRLFLHDANCNVIAVFRVKVPNPEN